MTADEIAEGLEVIADNWESGNVTDSKSDAYPDSAEQWCEWLRAAAAAVRERTHE
jgi:hypothetical protein